MGGVYTKAMETVNILKNIFYDIRPTSSILQLNFIKVYFMHKNNVSVYNEPIILSHTKN